MGFYLRRYIAALHAHKRWLLLALLPLTLYWVLAVLYDVTFTVSRDFSAYSGDIPVSAPENPTGTFKLGALTAEPDLLFLDGFAVAQLRKQVVLLEKFGGAPDDNTLRRVAHSTMALAEIGGTGLRLSYTGKDVTLGTALVAFYTDRLLKRIENGMARVRPRVAPPAVAFQPAGEIAVISRNSIWSSDRLLPATVVLTISVLGVLLLIAAVEASDSSFKSERQIARYLGLPVLGAIPDAASLARNLPG